MEVLVQRKMRNKFWHFEVGIWFGEWNAHLDAGCTPRGVAIPPVHHPDAPIGTTFTIGGASAGTGKVRVAERMATLASSNGARNGFISGPDDARTSGERKMLLRVMRPMAGQAIRLGWHPPSALHCAFAPFDVLGRHQLPEGAFAVLHVNSVPAASATLGTAFLANLCRWHGISDSKEERNKLV